MPLKDYTTKVPVSRTAAQIQGKLVTFGAREVLFQYDGAGQINALSFIIATDQGNIPIQMPLRVEKTLKVLQNQATERQIPKHYAEVNQARRVAWRILKDWLDAQLALLETEMVKMEEIFLPYVLMGEEKTLFEVMEKRGFYLTDGRD